MWYKEWVQCNVRTDCAQLYMLKCGVWEVLLFTLHAPPPKRRFALRFSSSRCYHHVDSVHAISFQEPRYAFRHLVLNVWPWCVENHPVPFFFGIDPSALLTLATWKVTFLNCVPSAVDICCRLLSCRIHLAWTLLSLLSRGSETTFSVGDWRSEERQRRRESSQCLYGSWDNMLGCVEEDDCKIGEVGERELVLVVSVRCGKERDMTRGWQTVFWRTNH